MLGSIDSPTCIRRSSREPLIQSDGKNTILCDPYGGTNLMQFIPTPPVAKSPEDKLPDNSVVLITTKLDHVAFFSKSGSGSLAQMVLLAARKVDLRDFLNSEFSYLGTWFNRSCRSFD